MQNVIRPNDLAVTQQAVPAWIREDDPLFIQFMKYHADFMNQDGMPNDVINNFNLYRNVETTTDQYAAYIIKQFLGFIPATSTVNKKLLMTKMRDFYQAKGTLPSYQFIMNLLYGDTVSIEWGKDYVFRASAAKSDRLGSAFTYSATPWTQNVVGAKLEQTFPSYASVVIENVTTTFVNNQIVNALDVDPESMIGQFVQGGQVRVLNNNVDRSKIYISTYYQPVAHTSSTVTVAIDVEVPRTYNGLILKQVGSTYRATISSLNTRTETSSGTQLVFNVSSVTGTIGTGDFYIVASSVENSVYTKDSFVTGILSPTVNALQITHAGAFMNVGDMVQHYGGTGTAWTARISDTTSGSVDKVSVTASGYGYAVNDPVVLTSTDGAGSGFKAIVSTVDGIGATLENIMELDAVKIRSSGQNYSIGDVITLTTGQNIHSDSVAQMTVSGIDTTVMLRNVTLTASGYGYQYANLTLFNNASSTVITGLVASPVITNGAISNLGITTIPSIPSTNVSVYVNGFGATATASVTAGVIQNTIVVGAGGHSWVDPVVIVTSSQLPTKVAQFSITVVAGVITGITVLDGGAGYASTVTISIQERFGYGASCAVVTSDPTKGPITAVSLTHRGAYTVTPTAYNTPTVSSSIGYGATFDLKFRVKSISLTDGGKLYRMPVIDATDGLGHGAVITPNIKDGVVNTITMSNNGSGYTYASAYITSATGLGFIGTCSIAAGQVTAIVINDGGYNYVITDNIVIRGDGINAAASFTVKNGSVRSFNIGNAGIDYAYDATVSYQMDPVSYPSAIAGTFQTTITNGEITSITVVNGGSGYVADTNDLKSESNDTFVLEDGSTRLAFDYPYNTVVVNNTGSPAIITARNAVGEQIGHVILDNAGADYYDPSEVTPTVITVQSSTGFGAVILPIIENGHIIDSHIVAGGEFYSSTDTIVVSGGGSGAAMTPKFYGGKVIGVNVTNSGSLYQYGTSAFIYGPGRDAKLAVSVNTSVTSVSVVSGGNGYTNPSFTVNGGGTGAVINATVVNGVITSVFLVSGGAGYRTPTVSISDATGAGAQISAQALRNIDHITVTSPGAGYFSAAVQIIGDGYGAKAHAIINQVTSLTDAKLFNGGTGYTLTPTIKVADVSNYGAISGVQIISGGEGYTQLPTVAVADKYNLSNVLIATGAQLTAMGAGIGGVKSVEFETFGSSWETLPVVSFPANVIVDQNANLAVGEAVYVDRYPYKGPVDGSFGFMLEDGSGFLLNDWIDGRFLTQDGFNLITEDGYQFTIESSGVLEQEFEEIYDANGLLVPYYDAGPTGIIARMDFPTNMVELSPATDSLILIAETGETLVSECGMPLVDQASNGIYAGDVLVGASSGAEITVQWIDRPSAVALASGAGVTPKRYTDTTGVLNNSRSKIINSHDVQDFAYTVVTAESLDTYKDVLTKTVHPAGYAMFGRTRVGTFGGGYPSFAPNGSTIRGADGSFGMTINLKSSFASLIDMQNTDLWFYNRTKQYWTHTPASVFSGYTFNNYDMNSVDFVSNIKPLVAAEAFVTLI